MCEVVKIINNNRFKLVGISVLILIVTLMLAVSAMGEISRAGLVAEYHFDGYATDSSGNGNHGTINGATFVQGISGQALSFDGVDDYVSSSGFNLNSSGTIEFWFRPNELNRVQDIVSKYLSGYGPNIWLDANNRLNFYVGGTYTGGKNDYNIGEWYHVAFIWSETNNYMKLYINGNQDIATTYNSLITSNVYIGVFYVGVGQSVRSPDMYFNGLIDEVCIYNRTLSFEEIKLSYDALTMSANTIGYSAMIATGQNTFVESSSGSFGSLLKGETKTISNSVVLNNTGDLSAFVEARFNDSISGVFGLINGSNLLNATNFALGTSGSLIPMDYNGVDVQVTIAPPGVTALDARLGVPSEQVAGDYSGTVVLTFSNDV